MKNLVLFIVIAIFGVIELSYTQNMYSIKYNETLFRHFIADTNYYDAVNTLDSVNRKIYKTPEEINNWMKKWYSMQQKFANYLKKNDFKKDVDIWVKAFMNSNGVIEDFFYTLRGETAKYDRDAINRMLSLVKQFLHDNPFDVKTSHKFTQCGGIKQRLSK